MVKQLNENHNVFTLIYTTQWTISLKASRALYVILAGCPNKKKTFKYDTNLDKLTPYALYLELEVTKRWPRTIDM